MKTIKHCDQCARSLFIDNKDINTKPLKSIELIKIFGDTGYKVNGVRTNVFIEKSEKNG